MADIIEMDELESFVLDFLAYRREQRVKKPVPHTSRRIEYKPEPAPFPATTAPMPHSIGKGWPHYKITKSSNLHAGPNMREAGAGQNHTPAIPSFTGHNDIIPTLAPIVAQELSRFGPPTTQKALDHLVNQIIASAMALPFVNESMQTAEIKPWGRVALLQAVVELLIRVSTM